MPGEENNIDHLQIQIDTDAGKAASGLDRLATSLDKLGRASGTINKSFFSDLAAGLKPLADLDLKGVGTTLNAVAKIPKAFEGLEKIDISAFSGQITKLTEALSPLAEKMRGIAPIFAAISHLKMPSIGEAGNSEKVKEASLNYKGLSSVLSKLAAPLNKATAGFKRFLKQLGSRVVSAFTSKIRGLVGGVQRLASSVQRIVFMRAIYAALRQITAGFKEGIDNLYQWSAAVDGRFKASMDRIATSMLYLKNSLAAMVSPIINRLAPAIDYLVDRFVDLLNIVNQVFSALTGNDTWTKAIKYPVEYAEGMADAAKSTKKAAKELKLFLLPFDELNVLTKDNPADTSTPGSAGQGGLNYAEMFETRELEDWAQKIKDLIDQGDWYGAGAALAEHLNGIIERWDSEAWGKELAAKLNHGIQFALGFMRTFGWETLGDKIGGFLNGFTLDFDWESFGALLATPVNSVSAFLKGMFKRFNGIEFGKGLGRLFNSWVETMNVQDIIDAFELGVEDATQIISSFFDTVDVDALAQKIADLLTGCDWENIMSQVWEVAKKAIGTTWKLGATLIDNLWNGYETDENGNKVSNPEKAKYGKGIVLGGATLGAGALSVGVIGKILGVVGKALPYISKIIEMFGGGSGALAGIGGALGAALPYVGTGAGLAGFAASEASAIKNGSNWKNALGTIGSGALAGASMGSVAGGLGAVIGGGIGMTVGMYTAVWTKAVQLISENWEKIKETASSVLDWISQAWTDTTDWISEKWTLVSDWLSEKWTAISGWVDENVIQPVKAVIDPIVVWISTAFEGAWIIVKAAWIIASEWFDANVIQPIVKLYTDIKEKIVSFLTEAWTRVKAVWIVVSTWFNEKVIQPLVKLYGAIKEKIVGFLTQAWSGIKNVWGVVPSWFNTNIISPLISAFNTAANFIKNAFSTAFGFVRSLAASVINGVIGTIEGGINNVISGLNWLIGIFNQVVSAAAFITGDSWTGLNEIGRVNLGRVDGGMDTSAAYSGIGGSDSGMFGSVANAFRNAMGGGAETINVNTYLDGEKVAQNTINRINKRTIANGQSPLYAY